MSETTVKNGGEAKEYTTLEAEAKRLKVSVRNFCEKVRLGLVPSYRFGSGKKARILLVSEEVDAALVARCRREAPLPA